MIAENLKGRVPAADIAAYLQSQNPNGENGDSLRVAKVVGHESGWSCMYRSRH